MIQEHANWLLIRVIAVLCTCSNHATCDIRQEPLRNQDKIEAAVLASPKPQFAAAAAAANVAAGSPGTLKYLHAVFHLSYLFRAFPAS